jgi:hypothetical protein
VLLLVTREALAVRTRRCILSLPEHTSRWNNSAELHKCQEFHNGSNDIKLDTLLSFQARAVSPLYSPAPYHETYASHIFCSTSYRLLIPFSLLFAFLYNSSSSFTAPMPLPQSHYGISYILIIRLIYKVQLHRRVLSLLALSCMFYYVMLRSQNSHSYCSSYR